MFRSVYLFSIVFACLSLNVRDHQEALGEKTSHKAGASASACVGYWDRVMAGMTSERISDGATYPTYTVQRDYTVQRMKGTT